MLSYKTPASLKADNARADQIMREKGHGPDNHVTRAPKEDKAAKGAALLASRKAG